MQKLVFQSGIQKAAQVTERIRYGMAEVYDISLV